MTSEKLTADLQKLSLKPTMKQSTVDPKIPQRLPVSQHRGPWAFKGERRTGQYRRGVSVSISDAVSSP